MKLRGVELALFVGDHRDRSIRRGADHLESRRQPGDTVAVAHPHRIALADLPHAVIKRRGLDDLDLGTAEFAMMPTLDRTAELLRHRLLAVADAQHGHAGLID